MRAEMNNRNDLSNRVVTGETDSGYNWTIGKRRYRRIEQGDLAYLREWRNEQIQVLRQQVVIDDEHQMRWWRDSVVPGYQTPRPNLFLVVCDGDHGPSSYGGLTNLDWVSRRAEISFLASVEIAADPIRYADEFGSFLRWVTKYAFSELGLRRLFTETWCFRDEHVRVLESAGLVLEGRLRAHVLKEGATYDALIHGLLAEDWHQQ